LDTFDSTVCWKFAGRLLDRVNTPLSAAAAWNLSGPGPLT